MKSKLILSILIAIQAISHGLEFKQNGKELVFKTKRTQIKIVDARITEIVNLKSNTVFASAKTPMPSKTAGIGTIANGRAKEMSTLHFPWGEPILKQALLPVVKTQLYRHPDARSRVSVEKKANSVTVSWQGLTDSVEFFPNDGILAVFSEDEKGAFTIESKAKTSDKGIFGFQFPIENIDGNGTFGLATYGGMLYDAAAPVTELLTFQGADLFYEAKLITYTLGDASLGYWFEDKDFRPYFVMLCRDKKSSSFAIELNSIMPYEQRDSLNLPPLKIDTFDDADWVAAATPYRNWYRKTFAEDLKKRDSITWANDICAISDLDVPSEAILDEMAKIVPMENLLFQCWNARKPNFDTKLPDYEPRDSYIAGVKRAHAKGARVMCYVCSLCANYNCEVWQRDKLHEFVLTRKNNITNYHGDKNVLDENLMGTLNAPKGKDQFGHLRKEQLIYTDPLSKGWREYFSDAVIKMNTTAGTDANYQDTLGCTSDNGNGFIDGFAGAQGNMLLARRLAEKLPGTPMASEFGPEPIAFAVHWPLNYTTVWGTDPFRKYRMHRQIPLAAFLFGYRTWIPLLRMGNDFLRHVGAACSDSLGGLGFFSPAKSITMKDGFNDHLNLRSHIFAKYGLKPYFPQRRFPKNVKAMYKAKNGDVFSYYDDGHIQILSDAKGRPLYGRLDNLNTADVKGLTLPGWPAVDGSLVTGLNPAQSYALFPSEGSAKAEISLGRLPEGTVVRYYYTTDNYAYIELEGKGHASITPSISSRFNEIYVNDERCATAKIEGELPLRIFVSDGTAVPPVKTRRINQSTGLAIEPPKDMPELKRSFLNKTFYYLQGYNDVVLDTVIDVKSDDDTVAFLHKNEQATYGNAYIISAFINGKLIKSLDTHPKGQPFDTQLRRWSFPIGAHKGKRILFSIRVDNKADNNSDMPFVSQPEIIHSNLKEFKEAILDPKAVVRPEGDPLKVVVPEFPKGAFLKEGVLKAGPNLSTICSTQRYPVEKDVQCILSGRLASESEKTVYFGIIQYDKNNKQIYGEHINRKDNATTAFAADAKAGDTYVMFKDATNWKQGAYISITQTLPCYSFAGTVKNVSKQGDFWKVELSKPLKSDIPSGTKAFMHLPMSTHLYVFSDKLPKTPAERGRAVEFWPGAASYQFLILAEAPVAIKDIKMELFRK